MKTPKLEIQTWECKTTGDKELQHFLPPDCTYVFGFNKHLLGERAYRRVMAIIRQSLVARKGVQSS